MLAVESGVTRISEKYNEVSAVISPPAPTNYRTLLSFKPDRYISVMHDQLDLIFHPIPCIRLNALIKSSYDHLQPS